MKHPGTALYELSDRIGTVARLDSVVKPVSAAVKKALPQGRIKDLLSGTWLGHQLHPLLTDIPIGSFTSATLLDLVGDRGSRKAADILVGVGIASSVPAIAAGLADWSDMDGETKRIGVVHAAANAVGIGLYGVSLIARRNNRRTAGTVLGLAGMGVMTVGGYLGGHLTSAKGIGINNAFWQEPPTKWTEAIRNDDLADGVAAHAELGNADVFLYRDGDELTAIGNRCTHHGGPLHEGPVDAGRGCVTCPWHDSVFRLADGGVVHGPATVPVPAYDVRHRNDHIEVTVRTDAE